MWRATGGPRNIQARVPGTAGAGTGSSQPLYLESGSVGVPRCGQSQTPGLASSPVSIIAP